MCVCVWVDFNLTFPSLDLYTILCHVLPRPTQLKSVTGKTLPRTTVSSKCCEGLFGYLYAYNNMGTRVQVGLIIANVEETINARFKLTHL